MTGAAWNVLAIIVYTVFTGGYRIGIGICYDMRFPDLAHIYADMGCHLLLYPGAFNMTTGPKHWELLQTARYFYFHFLRFVTEAIARYLH